MFTLMKDNESKDTPSSAIDENIFICWNSTVKLQIQIEFNIYD